MKVIFLDMDGVLNSAHYLYVEHRRSRGQRAEGRDWAEMIDPKMVARLNRIIERTGAKAVLSSSWRIVFAETMDEFREILRGRGFAGEVIDRTPIASEMGGTCTGVRGVEVAWWLGRAEVSSFVILDDSDDFPGLEDRLVRTSWAHGLTDEHVDRAVEILERP